MLNKCRMGIWLHVPSSFENMYVYIYIYIFLIYTLYVYILCIAAFKTNCVLVKSLLLHVKLNI